MIWDVATRRQAVGDLQHEGRVSAAKFSAGAGEVATASWDKSARLWDRGTGLPLADSIRHPDQVLALDFDPDGKWLVTGCRDGAARVWELPQASGPVPAWLCELAENIGGYRLTETDSLERIAEPDRLFALRDRLTDESMETDDEDEYFRWARWFFGDRDRRSVSPSAGVTMEAY